MRVQKQRKYLKKNRPSLLVSILACVIYFSACKEAEKGQVVLYYDFYCQDSLLPDKAIKIVQESNPSANFSTITIFNAKDSLFTTFYQKVSDSGLHRSADTVNFLLSHAFKQNGQEEIKWPAPAPYFLNVFTKNHSQKSFSTENNDSTTVTFFDEAIPWYSYTCSYYSQKDNVFLLLYNCSLVEDTTYKIAQDCFYRLSRVEGLPIDNKYIESLTTKIISDTSFFSRYYKPPSNVPPPPQN